MTTTTRYICQKCGREMAYYDEHSYTSGCLGAAFYNSIPKAPDCEVPAAPSLRPGDLQAVRLLIRQVEAIAPGLCKEGFAELAAVLSAHAAAAIAEVHRAEGIA